GKTGEIGSFLTREHSWPKQWWGGMKNSAYSDLFHVILGDAHVNGQKGIKPLGEVGEQFNEWAISKTGLGREGLGYDGEVFEPADEYKGDFARGYLYFAVRYLTGKNCLNCSVSEMIQDNGFDFEPWAIRMLMKWHKADPVSNREIKRNNEIYKIQGNRNPFIDHPEFADLIWKNNFHTGVDANYSIGMIENGKKWESEKINNIFEIFKNKGINSLRMRIWTCDTGPNSIDYAIKIAKECNKNNIAPYIVLFLSDNWSDYVKQPLPEKWKKLLFSDKVKEVREYSKSVVSVFMKNGIVPQMYEIGNEIDFGICGEFENEWHNRFNLEYMKKNIWIKSAQIIEAAQKGILEEDKNAKFILHLTQWWNEKFCIEFYNFMLENNVKIDFLGLSFFPTSNMSEKNGFDYFESKINQLSNSLKRKIIICEYAYPSKYDFGGQFSEWNKSVKDYDLNEKGQAKWINDFLTLCRENDNLQGAYYWSPEWFDSEMWEAFSLFNADGTAKEGINSFK
nr:glycosyl hydrolase 53 family protein [Candidatus Dependentiae bacterium]